MIETRRQNTTAQSTEQDQIIYSHRGQEIKLGVAFENQDAYYTDAPQDHFTHPSDYIQVDQYSVPIENPPYSEFELQLGNNQDFGMINENHNQREHDSDNDIDGLGLYHHQKTHEGQLFKCPEPECSKEYKTEHLLRRHLKVHRDHREGNLKCPHCEKTFCRADYLEIHIKRHLGQKDEKCPECGKGFVCKSDLIRHKLNVHSAFGRYQCPDCGKRLRSNTSLNRHRQSRLCIKAPMSVPYHPYTPAIHGLIDPESEEALRTSQSYSDIQDQHQVSQQHQHQAQHQVSQQQPTLTYDETVYPSATPTPSSGIFQTVIVENTLSPMNGGGNPTLNSTLEMTPQEEELSKRSPQNYETSLSFNESPDSTISADNSEMFIHHPSHVEPSTSQQNHLHDYSSIPTSYYSNQSHMGYADLQFVGNSNSVEHFFQSASVSNHLPHERSSADLTQNQMLPTI
ncbi:Oidioi.mRNA.OKI2018_I69.PAR.g9597.t2.cds [Oikopleura dioica]|uniref:Oidioi.mRNA.OKI2018_I69.PAR.g9597.t2.cds n=1 Tax=Oikopleura dioica TaxID=34765 RepID=A0ABN7RS70_OIKDI|nr:Oidioi.mRNA.OKI2018_I69.PAR.g9597.t2.cds [Oikopleura dioica]